MGYERSEHLLRRALEVIPNGTQTFSKSRSSYPVGASPFYAKWGEGAYLVDVDGNRFLDFTNGLMAVILGYNDPHVTQAVREQLEDGVLFTLPTELEIEVSEMLVDMIPCAEMVRFGKNGSDATTGAIRIARAFTGRDRVAQCGYHGWHDWAQANKLRNLGVPQGVRDLTHTFQYNNLASLRRLFVERPYQFAAVIIETMHGEWPDPGFLEECRDLAHKNGAIFIMDEVVTGFRFAVGGAQEYFGVTPDLATFGKALSNGYPLSAVVGREEVMQTMSNVHYSYTNTSEALSLAAAKATLAKIKRENVPARLAQLGNRIPGHGHPAWRHLGIPEDQKPLFVADMHKHGILTLGTANLTFAHTEEEVERLVEAVAPWQG